MASYTCTSRLSGSSQQLPFSDKLQHFKLSASASFKPFLRNLRQNFPLVQIDESYRRLREASVSLLSDVVDQVFEFVDEPLLPSQKNFAPVEEIGESVDVFVVEGRIPDDFEEGVYIRNGSNPTFGGFKSALRFGTPNELMSNTNVFEHAGKLYSVAENYLAQEIDITTLETLGNWDFDGLWNRPFTSHPKKAPATGELVTIGVDAQKPYCVLGVISADGKNLIHQVDLEVRRSAIIHEVGVTSRYNVIMDLPLVVDLNRVVGGGSLIKYEENEYARIGVMPRYGNADSIQWFQVETCSAFHIINCFEYGDEVIVMACRARNSIIPGPDLGRKKFEWFSRGLKHIDLEQETVEDGMLFSQPYQWVLNTKTGDVRGRYLTGTQFSMDFPIIHPNFVGVSNKYAYTQLVDSAASTVSGKAKYGGLAKLYLQERNDRFDEDMVRVEHHMFPKNTFCSGASFVAKRGGVEEDDGWIITFVHDEDMDTSQVYIVDAKQFSSGPIAKIALPIRVPYGFHGLFTPTG